MQGPCYALWILGVSLGVFLSKCAEVNVKLNPHALSPLWPDSSNKTGYGMMGPYDAWQDMLGKMRSGTCAWLQGKGYSHSM